MANAPVPKFLSRHDKEYIRLFIQYGDERKALREVFGPGTPKKKHDEIFNKPLAQKYYRKLMEEADVSLDVGAHLAMKTLMRSLSVNFADIYDMERGRMKDDVPEEYYDAVQQVKFDAETGAVTQLSFVNKLKAAEMVLKMKGQLNKQVDVNVNLSIAEQLKSTDVEDEEVDALIRRVLSGGEPIDAEIVKEEPNG